MINKIIYFMNIQNQSMQSLRYKFNYRLTACFASMLILLFTTLLSGCSFFSDNDTESLPIQPAIKSPRNINESWSVKPISGDTKQYNKFTPTLVKDEILIADDKGHLAAINKTTGKKLWSYKNKAKFSSSACLGNGQVFIGTQNARVIALNNKTAKKQWEQTVSDQVVGKPAYAHGIVVVKTLDGKLYGLDSKTGKQLWSYNEGNPQLVLKGESDPVIHKDQVITGFPDAKIVVLNIKTGTLDWEQQAAESAGFSTLARMIDINTTPVIDNDMVYVGTYQGNISAFSLATGHRTWEHKLSTYSGLTVDAKNVYVTDADGVLWAFKKRTGAVNWKQTSLKQYMLTEPVAYKNYIVVGDNIGNVQMFTKKDGLAIARTRVSGKPIYAAPVTDGKTLYVLSTDGKLTALRMS